MNWITGKDFQTAAEFIPLKESVVTNVAVSFGVRNFYDIPLAFRNLKSNHKGGRATILEFAMPKNPLDKRIL
ncbi:MAG: class I SAM-dependent methyltransferase [Ignavibacteriales bacterium]|nr:class I SAM-dependent methyltransferase [Ignavibacteriales bacterium]